MDRTDFDKGSTTVISIVMGFAFILIPICPILNYFGIGYCKLIWLSTIGLMLGAIGAVIRYAAFSTLGRFFTRTLRKVESHALVTSGIYKYIRHPGYLSDILIFFGLALAMGNLIAIILIPISFIPAYIYRIKMEEKMLTQMFGKDYIDYSKHTKKLIPFVF